MALSSTVPQVLSIKLKSMDGYLGRRRPRPLYMNHMGYATTQTGRNQANILGSVTIELICAVRADSNIRHNPTEECHNHSIHAGTKSIINYPTKGTTPSP